MSTVDYTLPPLRAARPPVTFRQFLRVGCALMLGAFASAAQLAVLLIVLANVDAGLPTFNDVELGRILGMGVAFCFFTVPVSWTAGLPLYFLFRRFNLLKVWVCAVMGALAGVLSFYGILILPGVHGVVEWRTAVWLGLSGAGAGTVVGLLVRPPRRAAQRT